MSETDRRTPAKGRGAVSNPEGRFESRTREPFDDGWASGRERPARDGRAGGREGDHDRARDGDPGAWPMEADPGDAMSGVAGDDPDEPAPIATTLHIDHARTIIARNASPDIPFTQSINPYRGCEHGCVYCYARPSHAYLNLSPGLDFETQLFYKPNAAALLEEELRKPDYRCSMIALGSNTDPYQPIERELKVTRGLLEVLRRFRHPVGIVTKGAALIERDTDILQDLARDGLATVAISITTLDPALKRTLEPRAASGAARLRALRRLAAAGIPTMVMFSPVIPFVNDAELETVLAAAREAGARQAGYTMLRLPYEVKDLFREWLDAHLPLKAAHVMSLVQQMRGGRDNDPRFGSRMAGQGEYVRILRRRFEVACRRLGLSEGERSVWLDTTRFRVPPRTGDQLDLAL